MRVIGAIAASFWIWLGLPHALVVGPVEARAYGGADEVYLPHTTREANFKTKLCSMARRVTETVIIIDPSPDVEMGFSRRDPIDNILSYKAAQHLGGSSWPNKKRNGFCPLNIMEGKVISDFFRHFLQVKSCPGSIRRGGAAVLPNRGKIDSLQFVCFRERLPSNPDSCGTGNGLHPNYNLFGKNECALSCFQLFAAGFPKPVSGPLECESKCGDGNAGKRGHNTVVSVDEIETASKLRSDPAAEGEAGFVAIVGGLVAGGLTYAGLKMLAVMIFRPDKKDDSRRRRRRD